MPVSLQDDPRQGWPYAVQSLFDAPSAELIEDHASALLSKALNTGRTVAFVGAGASMAYGRISWRDLVISARARVLEEHKNAPELHSRKRVRATSELLKEHKLTRGEPGKTNHFTTVFQLTEQLSDALRQASGDKSSGSFRAGIIEATRDDFGQAVQIYADGLFGNDESPDTTQVRKILNENDDQRHDFRENKFLEHIIARTEYWLACDGWNAEHMLLNAAKKAASLQEKYVLPLHRYLNGCLLKVLEHPDLIDKARWNSKKKIFRSELIEKRHRDPLLMVLERLGISRFLTTNYDLEIERLFSDQGFRRHEAEGDEYHAAQRDDPLGPRTSDFVFSQRRMGELAAFAIRDRGSRGEVAHLHGRAEENGEIIATERDYIGRYARSDETGLMMQDITKLAFASNPILFIGSGMGEDDLLRPLREFMSTPERTGDRIAVALVPDEARDDREREIEKIRRLNENGVYIVHYGLASVNPPSARNKGVPWLKLVTQLRQNLDKAIQPIASLRHGAETEIPLKLEGALTNAASFLADIQSLIAELNRRGSGNKSDQLIAPNFIEGITTDPEIRSSIDVDVEVESLNAACAFVACTADMLRYLSATTCGREQRLRRIVRLADACIYAVAGAYDGLVGAFLCARLLRVRDDWDVWKAERLEWPRGNPPRHSKRLMAFKYGVSNGQHDEICLVQRHAIELGGEVEGADGIDEGPPADSLRRFYPNAPSQTFNVLMDALHRSSNILAVPPAGRRTFLLIGRRGVGKGHFFASLQSAEQAGALESLLGALGGRNDKARWVAAGFYNLSFSNEIASVFDGLCLFLLDHLRKVVTDQAAVTRIEVEANKPLSRVDKLRFLLREIRASAKEGQPQLRLLIAINSIGVLFEANGRPKNAQLGRLFDALVGKDAAGAPVDLVLVCGENNIPSVFRGGSANALGDGALHPSGTARDMNRMRLLVRHDQSEKGRLVIRERIQRLDLKVRGDDEPIDEKNTEFVMFLHEVRASVLLSAYFPSVALLVAWGQLQSAESFQDLRANAARSAEVTARSYPNVFARQTARSIRGRIKRILSREDYDRVDGPTAGASRDEFEEQYARHCLAYAKSFFPRLLAAAAVAFELRLDWPNALLGPDGNGRELIAAMKGAVRAVSAEPRWGHPDDIGAVISRGLMKRLADATADDGLKECLSGDPVQLDWLADLIDRRLGVLYSAVGRNRYALTILAATTYEDLVPIVRFGEDGEKGNGRSKPTFDEEWRRTSRRALTFLNRVEQESKEFPPARRDGVAIEQVLQKIKRRHESGEPLAIVVDRSKYRRESSSSTCSVGSCGILPSLGSPPKSLCWRDVRRL